MAAVTRILAEHRRVEPCYLGLPPVPPSLDCGSAF